MKDTLDEFKKQHVDNYKKAVIELIKNNTRVLFDEDINSLIKKPPLDSMDIIKSTFLDLAKKNGIVLNTNNLTAIIDDYREELTKFNENLKQERTAYLVEIVSKYNLVNDLDVIKFNKKDFIEINKLLKKKTKVEYASIINKKIVNNVNSIFTNDVSDDIRKRFVSESEKFLLGKYHKQLLENIDFKVLVKDTTLINLVKEQGERYIFTKKNSYIFKGE